MVDLPFARIALALAAALALGACAADRLSDVRSFPQPHPRSGSEVRKAIAAALERGDRERLSWNVLQLAWMMGSLSPATFDSIAPGLDPEILKRVRGPWMRNDIGAPRGSPTERLRWWFERNGDARYTRAASAAFAQVPADYRLVEGIAWDDRTARLFVGTVVDGRLAWRDMEGGWNEISLGSPRAGLFGMGIDQPHRLLWIATGAVEQTAVAGERMAGLIGVDLDKLAVVRRVPLAVGAAGVPGDLAVAPDGTVYVSNAVSGAVHRCRPGCALLEDMLPAGSFRSPQGMAILDGRLYVADYSTGLWRIDPATGQAVQLAVDAPTMVEGIDGLLAHDGRLVAIQNGTRPRRVAVIQLDRAGTRITGAVPWITVAEAAGEPTLGTLLAGDLLFVGDGQWERYGAGGVLKDGKPARPTPILSARLYDEILVTR